MEGGSVLYYEELTNLLRYQLFFEVKNASEGLKGFKKFGVFPLYRIIWGGMILVLFVGGGGGSESEVDSWHPITSSLCRIFILGLPPTLIPLF